MQLLLTTGEQIPVPLTVARLRQPQTAELLHLMNTYVFLPRFERCYRMLEQATGREVTAEVWATLPSNAVLITLTSNISGALQQGLLVARRRSLSSVQRRRQPTATSLARDPPPPIASGGGSSSNNSRGASSRSPGQDQYLRYAQHLSEYTQDVLQLQQHDAVRGDSVPHGVRGLVTPPPPADAMNDHGSPYRHQRPETGAALNNGSMGPIPHAHAKRNVTTFVSCVVGEITVPRGVDDTLLHGHVDPGAPLISPVHRNGTPSASNRSPSWPSREATPQQHALAVTPPSSSSTAPPMHRSAVSLVSAVARDKGAALLECMFDIVDERDREARMAVPHDPPPTIPSSALPYAPSGSWDESVLMSAVPTHLMERLMDMGFSQRLSCRALLHCRMDPSAAVDHVLHMSPDDHARCEQPMMMQEIQQYASLLHLSPVHRTASPPSSLTGAPPPPYEASAHLSHPSPNHRPHQGRSASPSQPIAHDASRRGALSYPLLTAEERAKRVDFTQLLDMGFNATSARMALKAMGGDFNEACAALLGDPAAMTKFRAYQHEHRHHANGIGASNSGGAAPPSSTMLWYEPIEAMVKAGQLHPHNVVDVVRAVNLDPQNIVLMWHCARFGPTVARMAAVFSTSQINRGNPVQAAAAGHPPSTSLNGSSGAGPAVGHVWGSPNTSQPSSQERHYRR